MIFTDHKIIHPETLELLANLQSDLALKDFFLVGGTSLALQIGHRLSIDLDLFTQNTFETQELEQYLSNKHNFFTDYVASNTLKGFINGVKVDFIMHHYPLVNPLEIYNPYRLASLQDIGAMKLNAIGHSGNRQKDFYDLYFLLEHFSLKSLMETYQKKYPKSNPIIPLKSLVYFDDIDFEIENPLLVRKVSFEEVKERLIIASKLPNKKFD